MPVWYWIKLLIHFQFTRCIRWKLRMDNQFHPTLYNWCSYSSILVLMLNHVSKYGHWGLFHWLCPTWSYLAHNSSLLLLSPKAKLVSPLPASFRLSVRPYDKACWCDNSENSFQIALKLGWKIPWVKISDKFDDGYRSSDVFAICCRMLIEAAEGSFGF